MEPLHKNEVPAFFARIEIAGGIDYDQLIPCAMEGEIVHLLQLNIISEERFLRLSSNLGNASAAISEVAKVMAPLSTSSLKAHPKALLLGDWIGKCSSITAVSDRLQEAAMPFSKSTLNLRTRIVRAVRNIERLEQMRSDHNGSGKLIDDEIPISTNDLEIHSPVSNGLSMSHLEIAIPSLVNNGVVTIDQLREICDRIILAMNAVSDTQVYLESFGPAAINNNPSLSFLGRNCFVDNAPRLMLISMKMYWTQAFFTQCLRVIRYRILKVIKRLESAPAIK